jgi:glycine/D-amino acid oxidase-like deaminating enzyme
MGTSTDAIVIGAGIIGCCTAFELAKKGYRTLNIDKMPGAGHGSTGNSCAIIRVHYSTFDGAAMAQEGKIKQKNKTMVTTITKTQNKETQKKNISTKTKISER